MPTNPKSKGKRKVSKLPRNMFKKDAEMCQKLAQLSANFNRLMEKSKDLYIQASTLLSRLEKEKDREKFQKLNTQIQNTLSNLPADKIETVGKELYSKLDECYKPLTSTDEIGKLLNEL